MNDAKRIEALRNGLEEIHRQAEAAIEFQVPYVNAGVLAKLTRDLLAATAPDPHVATCHCQGCLSLSLHRMAPNGKIIADGDCPICFPKENGLHVATS